ncbi:Ca2+-binding RTX toxin-like protein [Acinetobacter baylyi]|uniref:Ca2+-binding RTX toxin-like protein n=1 Tax=Acinetobacter baylyi TaxID=202950 RepID=A0ABU0UVF9_ACIBI|nr:calcium-binding protein [Acinetobacter baylyi]MDQ1208531.1 Ca2+-binding RTX toxin-like protein [Acinetobacter baylyi]MDR6107879.1 Ca2+-binding RTX toxin-like protein [Acinetobacter baylyi]MDR6185404.1 Ca2+-binding RTX toxin-like protein [Acinetobacter baylyi]
MDTADKILDGYDKANTAKDIIDKAQTANDLRKELSNPEPLNPESGGTIIGLILPMIPGASGIDGDEAAKWGENAARNIRPTDRVDAAVDAAVNGSSSQGKFHYVDPLILDLDGNGIETTGLEKGIQFELNTSGLKVTTGWASANDGLLVWDRNNDGKINDASELFGNHVLMNDGSISEHGFAALKDLDFNDDDTVDINDEAFNSLRVWKDTNQDGVSQENELFTLNELEIKSLNVNYVDTKTKFENGNIISQIGDFNKIDGSSHVMGDVNFAIDITKISREHISLEQIDFSNLFLLGSGRVSDLQSAITISEELEIVIEKYKSQASISDRDNLLEKIILEWAKTDPYYSENINLVGQWMLTANEGVAIRRTSGNNNSAVIDNVVTLKELPLETQQKFEEIKPYIAALSSFTGNNISTLYFNGRDLSGSSAEVVIDKFYEAFHVLKAALFQELYPQTFFLEQFGNDIYFLENNKVFLDIPNIFNTINDLFLVNQSEAFKSLFLLQNHLDSYRVKIDIENLNYLDKLFEHYVTSVDGVKINQWFEELSQYGYEDSTVLIGTDLNDNLQNTSINTNSYIYSGNGNDQLTGNNYTDKIWGGIGNDTIYGRGGDDLLEGEDGDDKLYGEEGTDILKGGLGNDLLDGGAGNDILEGGEGNDNLSGGAGDDILNGGAGNDTLNGGAGNNIYIFGRGDGQDTVVSSYDTNVNKLNVLKLKEGISASDLIIKQVSSSLEISISGSTDKITFQDILYQDSLNNPYSSLQQIEFSDGTILKVSDILQQLYLGTANADWLAGTTASNHILGGLGNDTIYGRGGDDLLEGEDGDDKLYGEEGADILKGGLGSDLLDGGAGNDILEGGEGNDNLSGGAGDDILNGGAGNDTLNGGTGNNIYIFGRGDGQDTVVSSYDTNVNKLNVLKLKEGISASDLIIKQVSSSLEISISGSTDKITFQDILYQDSLNNPYSSLQQIEFSDGTILKVSDILQQLYLGTANADWLAGTTASNHILGGLGNDTIYGRGGDDLLEGEDGDDKLYGEEGADILKGGLGSDLLDGGAGNDILEGGEGNDNLSGGAGDDILNGGAGNDTLNGGAGNNIYIFGRGDGQDTVVSSYDTNVNKLNVLKLKEGISASDLIIKQVSSSLEISISGSTDKITFQDILYQDSLNNPYSSLQQIEFSDGTILKVSDILQQLYLGTANADWLAGTTASNHILGGLGNDTIYGRGGDDLLEGEDGDDKLYGEEGADILKGGLGSDLLDGGAGNDILEGGEGNDNLSGGAGDDILNGGAGNDTLNGGAGNNIYIFGRGDGQDTVVSSYDTNVNKLNVLKLKEGISASDLIIKQVSSSLEISISGSTDKITFQDILYQDSLNNPYSSLQQIEFSDGTILKVSDILQQLYLGTANADWLAGTTASNHILGGLGNDTIYGRGGDDLLEGEDGDDKLYGEEGADILKGGLGSDLLDGGAGNDILEGGEGNDNLSGGAGDDILNGGAGNDTLNGGAGNNIYIFGRGDGQDTVVSSYDTNVNKLNVLKLKEGISASDLIIKQVSSSLEISISGSTDKITFQDILYQDSLNNPYSSLQQIEFSDGTILKVSDILQQLYLGTANADLLIGDKGMDHILGGLGNDTIYGRGGDDLLEGEDGDDKLYGEEGTDILKGGLGNDLLDGGAGNDILEGGEGNDNLSGGAGDDILNGGAGNDTLNGGAGNNIYIFGRGDGQDTVVSSYDTNVNKLNVLKLKEGISASDLIIKQVSSSLEISISGSTDKITFQDILYQDSLNNPYSSLQQIEFSDGTILKVSDILQQLYLGTANADWLAGTTASNHILGGLGNDTIYGRGGDDLLEGEDGDDKLYGEEGADILKGGLGSDLLDGGAGNDILEGGEGNDNLSGGAGDDILNGGAGNDTLNGGTGNNIYIFGRGDGQDTVVSSYDTNVNKLNVLKLKEGISASDLIIKQVSSSLEISISGSTDKITFQDILYQDSLNNPYSSLQQIEFSDGTILKVSDILQQLYLGTANADWLAGTTASNHILGGLGNDTIYGRGGDDLLEGEDGDDKLYGEEGADILKGGLGSDLLDGGAGNDILEGGEGNDNLSGGAGDDILNGGAGNDTLNGGAGNNIYIFGRGDGQDTVVSSYDTNVNKLNVLKLKEGISASDLIIKQVSSSLEISISGSTDKITFQDILYQDSLNNPYSSLQQIEFSDGTILKVSDILQQLYLGTANADWLAGTTASNHILGGLGNDTIYGRGGDDLLEGEDGDDKLYGEEGADILKGGLGNDLLDGGAGNDILEGGEGNDNLSGGAGDDILNGGAGNDTLNGGTGNNIYIFGRGDGQDTVVSSYDTNVNKLNVLKLKEGISASDLIIKQVSSSLEISISGSTDKITFQDILYQDSLNNPYSSLQQIEFSDGTILKVSDILQQLYLGTANADWLAGTTASNHILGGLGNDTIYGRGGDDLLEGEDGDDKLYGEEGADILKGGLGSDLLDGGAGNDILEGGEGNDNLSGGAGDDILNGGAGNDTLNGGTGNNIYIFGRGDGQDTVVSSYDTNVNKLNVLKLKEGISASDLIIKQVSSSLEISISGSTDKITFQDILYQDSLNNPYSSLQQIEFSDGTILKVSDILQQLYLGTANADWLAGTTASNHILGGLGNDTIYGRGGDDLLEGEDGDDKLYGEEGADILKGGLGNDLLDGGAGNDILEGGEGNDNLSGGAGDDILNGGAGNDTLNGGSGSDTAIFKILQGFENDAIGGNGIDTWVDFNLSQGDKIDISDLLVGDVNKANLNQFISYEKNGTTVTLSIDRDGSAGNFTSSKLLILNNQLNVNNLDDLIKVDTFII